MVSRNESEGFEPREFSLCRNGPRVALPGSQYRCSRNMARLQRRAGVAEPALSGAERAAAGHPTDCIGTWESRIACMPQQAERQRRGHGDTAVGPVHSRGVAGVIPGGGPRNRDPLEGAGSQLSRAEEVWAIHRDG